MKWDRGREVSYSRWSRTRNKMQVSLLHGEYTIYLTTLLVASLASHTVLSWWSGFSGTLLTLAYFTSLLSFEEGTLCYKHISLGVWVALFKVNGTIPMLKVKQKQVFAGSKALFGTQLYERFWMQNKSGKSRVPQVWWTCKTQFLFKGVIVWSYSTAHNELYREHTACHWQLNFHSSSQQVTYTTVTAANRSYGCYSSFTIKIVCPMSSTV